MTFEREEPIIEAGLHEALGHVAPPDLSARILATWAARTTGAASDPAASGEPQVLQPPPFPGGANRPIPLPKWEANFAEPPVQSAAVEPRSRASSPRGARQLAARVSFGLVALALVVAIGYLVPRAGRTVPGGDSAKGNGEIAQSQENVNGQPATSVVAGNPPAGGATERGPAREQVSTAQSPATAPQPAAAMQDSQLAGQPLPPPPFAVAGENRPMPKVEVREPAYEKPASDADVIAYINQQLAAAWKQAGITPSPPATDEEWCRRVYLRLIGRIPTVEELRAFTRSKSPDKRRELVNRLLESESYAAEFSRYWSEHWTNLLIGRTGGTQSEGLARREGLQQYLRGEIAKNRPLRELTQALLGATGSNNPQASDYNGAVDFLLACLGEKATLATDRTSRVFLGSQLSCVQCHNHPTNEVATQQQYWELNSFFRQAEARREAGGFARLNDVDFLGEEGNNADEAEVYFEQRNGLMKVAYPALPGGAAVPRSGRVAELNRRALLAQWVANSEQLPRAYLNRLWSNFLGFGFTRPIDDLGPHNRPSHPELLERLAREFSARQTDMRAAMRWVVLSDAFALSSRILPGNQGDDPQAGATPLFARYYTRQLQAEEVYQSLLLAAKPGAAAAPAGGEQARQLWLGQFARSMNTDEGDEIHIFNGTIPQSLTMMNGELMRQATSQQAGSLLHRVVTAKLTPAEKVEHLFMSALARAPTRKELDAALKILAQRPQDSASALEDIWWALLNSNEFILDH